MKTDVMINSQHKIHKQDVIRNVVVKYIDYFYPTDRAVPRTVIVTLPRSPSRIVCATSSVPASPSNVTPACTCALASSSISTSAAVTSLPSTPSSSGINTVPLTSSVHDPVTTIYNVICTEISQETPGTIVYSLQRDDWSATGNSAVAIDNKIEQAMDLVKSHLMFAVREEVEVLKERIAELMDRINQLETENSILKTHATPDTLALLTSVPQTQVLGGQISSGAQSSGVSAVVTTGASTATTASVAQSSPASVQSKMSPGTGPGAL